MSEASRGPASTSGTSQGSAPAEGSAVLGKADIERLAKKIYALLKQELRIERERLGRHGPR